MAIDGTYARALLAAAGIGLAASSLAAGAGAAKDSKIFVLTICSVAGPVRLELPTTERENGDHGPTSACHVGTMLVQRPKVSRVR